MPRNLYKTIERAAERYNHFAAKARAATCPAARSLALNSSKNYHADYVVARARQQIITEVNAINEMAGYVPGKRYRHQVEVTKYDALKQQFEPYTWAMENLQKPWRVYYWHGSMFFGSTCPNEATMFKVFWG